MSRRSAWAIALTAFVLIVGTPVAVHLAYSRPVVPVFSVDLRNAARDNGAAQLLLIFGDRGSDPFRSGTLAPDQRVTFCATSERPCTSRPGRSELLPREERRQSLQLRLLGGGINAIIGGVTWTGQAYPERVRISCDLRVANVRRTCTVADVKVLRRRATLPRARGWALFDLLGTKVTLDGIGGYGPYSRIQKGIRHIWSRDSRTLLPTTSK